MRRLSPIAVLLALLGAGEARALTLNEAYRSAVRITEGVARSEEAITAAEAEYRKRLGVAIPSLSFLASELIQDVPPSGSGSTSAVQNTFVRRFTPDLSLEGRYTIFAGLREWSALQAAKADVRKNRELYQRAIQLLYADTANAFFFTLQRGRELEMLEALDRNLADRVKELRRFERLGRSRASERITVEADRKRLESAIVEMKGDLDTFRSMLSFVTGLSPLPELTEPAPTPVEVPGLDACLKDAERRPDVAALEAALAVARKIVSFEQGACWPVVDLKGHYYLYRVGFRSDIDWDVGFFLNWPLYEGGQTKASVAQARSGERQAELNLREGRRRARLEVESQHARLSADARKLAALREALSLTEETYRLQSKEYRLGLVTNLEVLNALSNLYETKRSYEQSRFAAQREMAALAVARGKTPEVR